MNRIAWFLILGFIHAWAVPGTASADDCVPDDHTAGFDEAGKADDGASEAGQQQPCPPSPDQGDDQDKTRGLNIGGPHGAGGGPDESPAKSIDSTND